MYTLTEGIIGDRWALEMGTGWLISLLALAVIVGIIVIVFRYNRSYQSKNPGNNDAEYAGSVEDGQDTEKNTRDPA